MTLRESSERPPDPAEAALHIRATAAGDIECVHGEERLWCVSGEATWHRLAAELHDAIAAALNVRNDAARRLPRAWYESHNDPDGGAGQSS